jgi:hypothetical protein
LRARKHACVNAGTVPAVEVHTCFEEGTLVEHVVFHARFQFRAVIYHAVLGVRLVGVVDAAVGVRPRKAIVYIQVPRRICMYSLEKTWTGDCVVNVAIMSIDREYRKPDIYNISGRVLRISNGASKNSTRLLWPLNKP